jgi:hypothetical protein
MPKQSGRTFGKHYPPPAVDQVIASVPVRAFSQANEAQFYVTMLRARWAMHVFSDNKVALRDAIAQPSKRLSSWELLNPQKHGKSSPIRSFGLVQRETGGASRSLVSAPAAISAKKKHSVFIGRLGLSLLRVRGC